MPQHGGIDAPSERGEFGKILSIRDIVGEEKNVKTGEGEAKDHGGFRDPRLGVLLASDVKEKGVDGETQEEDDGHGSDDNKPPVHWFGKPGGLHEKEKGKNGKRASYRNKF